MKMTHLLIYRVRGRNLDFKNSEGEKDLPPIISNGGSLPEKWIDSTCWIILMIQILIIILQMKRYEEFFLGN